MGEKETLTAEDAAARSKQLNVSASPGGSVGANLADEGGEAGSPPNADARLTSVGKTKYNEKTNEST